MNNEMIPPKPKTPGAKVIVETLPQLRSFLHGSVDAGQFCAGLIAECNRLDPAVTTSSIQVAAMNLCVIGLMPGPALGHAHLVPFKDKGTPRAQLVIGYKGFLELAYANNFLRACTPELILRGETVERWHDEDGPHFRHEIPADRPHPDRKNIVGAYCSWQTVAGGKGATFVDLQDIKRADKGENWNTPWKTDYPAMVLKCPIRKAGKLWRISQRLADAIMIDEQADRGVEQSALRTFPGSEPDDDPEDVTIPQIRAILRDKVGCDQPDEVMVAEWAVGSSFEGAERLEDIPAEELSRALSQLMQWPQISGGNDWDKILPLARKRMEEVSG